MEKELFIYGAAVQGIQNFIFRTNELKDIVGASELVERICTSLFEEEFKQSGEPIVMAAGNIKCVFQNEEECRKAVKLFPKKVMEAAPGITISQAVVKTTAEELETVFPSLMNRLEGKLHAQRNRQAKNMTLGLMSMERSRKTGLPAVECVKGEYIDEATQCKRKLSEGAKVTIKLCEKSFGQKELSPRNIALNIADMTNRNDWIAIIHADGNGLGEVVQRKSRTKEGLASFSQKLDEATVQAARAAFKSIITSEQYEQNSEKFPFRPIVLGGDDMTMICRASLALPYVEAYLKNFEEATKQKLGAVNGLTACAGIAYIKSSYPFHYGYELAETLCSQAKKVSKSPQLCQPGKPAPSSVMFYKVQSSFVEDYDSLISKEKTPCDGVLLSAGPYFLHQTESYWTINELETNVSLLSGDDGNVVKTKIRKWLTSMHQERNLASQDRSRSMDILTASQKKVFEIATEPQHRPDDSTDYYPASDIIDLHTIQNQKTRED